MVVFIKRAWRWSRTIFINAVMVLATTLAAIIPYLLGLDWRIVFSPEQAFWVMLAINIVNGVVNIILRVDTVGPVGSKDEVVVVDHGAVIASGKASIEIVEKIDVVPDAPA